MILVVGGTGDLGSRIVRRLREEQDEPVRCLVRAGADRSKLDDLVVEMVEGDLTVPESLNAACSGVETVVASATMVVRRLAGARHPSVKDVDEVGMTALVEAA